MCGYTYAKPKEPAYKLQDQRLPQAARDQANEGVMGL